MEINVIAPGKSDDFITLFKIITHRIADKLGIDTNKITIEFTPTVSIGDANEEHITDLESYTVYGCVTDFDIEAGNYHIQIAINQKQGRQAFTLCHEMIHVCQYASGRLKPAFEYCTRLENGVKTQFIAEGNYWEGKFYPVSTPYEERPWETEAKAQDMPLFKSFQHE